MKLYKYSGTIEEFAVERGRIHQPNKLTADLTQQEVDAVAALLAGIVVETDDKGINFQAGDRSCTHLAIDGYGLRGTNRPVVCTLPSIADSLDDCPAVAAERFGHQRNGHRECFAGRCSIVGICTHIDRNSGTAGRLCGHRDGGAGNTYRCNVRTARGCGHRTAARPRNSDGARGFRVGQAQTACGQRNTAGRLADRPRSALGRSRPIRPLIIGSRGKGGAVAASVGCAARATDRQLRTVIVAPRRGLRRAIVSHAAGLCRHILDLGSANRPRHTLGFLRAVRPDILADTPHLSRYIVPAADGGDMTRSAFTRLWNSHVAALVPFSLHPHMLRHTYATTLYRAGVDLRTAQKLMGHSSIQVTADIYTHLEQEDSLHVADKLNEYLSGKSENSAKSSQKVVKLAI